MSAIRLSFDSNGGGNPSIIFEFPDCANQKACLFFGEKLFTFCSDVCFEKTLPIGKKLWISYYVPLRSTHFGVALGDDAGYHSTVIRCVCFRILRKRKPFSFLDSFLTRKFRMIEKKQQQLMGPIFFEEKNVLDFLSVDNFELVDKRAYQLPEKLFQELFPRLIR